MKLLAGLDKDALLKELATNGYNVGFGAKKNFATYDIITKIPGFISLVGLLIGVGQLAYPKSPFNTGISTVLVMASIIGMAISPFNSEKDNYNQRGIDLTDLFNQLRRLYFKVQNSTASTFESEEQEMNNIMSRYYSMSMSNQIFGSDWYAHYKFFRQMQIDWIDEQKGFKFWKDKMPTSFIWFIVVIVLIIPLWVYIFKGELPFVS